MQIQNNYTNRNPKFGMALDMVTQQRLIDSNKFNKETIKQLIDAKPSLEELAKDVDIIIDFNEYEIKPNIYAYARKDYHEVKDPVAKRILKVIDTRCAFCKLDPEKDYFTTENIIKVVENLKIRLEHILKRTSGKK